MNKLRVSRGFKAVFLTMHLPVKGENTGCN